MATETSILELLNDVGLGEKKKLVTKTREATMPERLEQFGLGLNEMIVATLSIIEDPDVLPSTKLAAIRDVFKMHGVLKENPQSAVTPVTIVINDAANTSITAHELNNGGQVVNISPILIPRELISNEIQQ